MEEIQFNGALLSRGGTRRYLDGGKRFAGGCINVEWTFEREINRGETQRTEQ